MQKKGLWVACQGKNRLLDSRKGIEVILALVDKHGISDLFVQLFRSGRAWYASENFELAPGSQWVALQQAAAARKLRLHAWVNVCNASLSPSEGFMKQLGQQQARLLDQQGRDSLQPLDPFVIDTPGQWLEPSNPALLAVMQLLVSELSALPIDGIHLDFIRYPYSLPIKPASWIEAGLDFGYSDQALTRFLAGRDRGQYFIKSANGNLLPACEKIGQEFDAWRRQQIENLVEVFRAGIGSSIKLSVAALAWSDRAYLNAYQDWRAWLSRRLIDSLCLMTYSADSHLIEMQIRQAMAFLQPGQEIFGGLGIYKLSSLADLESQSELVASLGAYPCIFCADSLSVHT